MLEVVPPPARLPGFVGTALRPLPLLGLQIALQGLATTITRQHPELLKRLGTGTVRCISIDPTDLPFAILLEPQPEAIMVRVVREVDPRIAHSRIRAPFLALIGLVDGSYDGDALFFSRDITIEGDIETALALRNAIDDAQIDLLRAATSWAGPLAGPLHHAVLTCSRRCTTVVKRWQLNPR